MSPDSTMSCIKHSEKGRDLSLKDSILKNFSIEMDIDLYVISSFKNLWVSKLATLLDTSHFQPPFHCVPDLAHVTYKQQDP